MKKRVYLVILGGLLVVGAYFAGRAIRDAHYPIPIKPSESWEPFVNSLDAERETVFVENDGVKLEAELFIPTDGQERKPAVVFTPGSSDSLIQNYAFGLVETFIVDLFLSRDFAVVLVNKRGMGQSEGNYVKNSITGRAADVYAVAQEIQSRPEIDPDNVGLIGHSQGGWVVTQAAADHPDIAFFISLAGPTTTMKENAADNYYHFGRCQGLENEELEAYIDKRMKMVDLSMRIGRLTNFGFFGFDARNMDYDPRNALQTIQNPGLLIYAENDDQVTPALSIDRLNEIFADQVPDNLSAPVIKGATHAFRLVDDPCDSWVEVEEQQQADELAEIMQSWLTDQGY
jgi:pimeloyl-ACP methyl ester carboxylesterase